jgi:hypothetical protein
VNTQSWLGRTLLARKKYADAEPLLLASYEGLKNPSGEGDEKSLELLVKLYEATGKKEKAEMWRKKLQEARSAAKPAGKP